MGMLGRDAILGVDDLTREKMPTPEWGVDAFVYVRELTGTERGAFESMMSGKHQSERLSKFRAALCVFGICDESGKSIFTMEDVDALSAKSSAPLDRCFDKIRALSGMTRTEVEAIEKNSEATSGDGG